MASIYKRNKSWNIQWSDSKGRHRKTLGKIRDKDAIILLRIKEDELAYNPTILGNLQMNKDQTFAERVKICRKKQKLSQSGLASILNITYMNIANIETGRVKSPRYLSKLAKALKTSVSYLVDGKTAEILEFETPTYIASLSNEISQDPRKEYWVVENNKDSKLLLIDGAKKIAKLTKIFN